jgi:hypothetical protein
MKKISILLVLLALLGLGFIFFPAKTTIAYSLNKTSFKYYLPETIIGYGSLSAASPDYPAGFIQTSIHTADGTKILGTGDLTYTGGGNGQPYSMQTVYNVPKTSGTASYIMRFFAVKYGTLPNGGSTTETVDVPFTVTEIPPTLTIFANGSPNNITVNQGT